MEQHSIFDVILYLNSIQLNVEFFILQHCSLLSSSKIINPSLHPPSYSLRVCLDRGFRREREGRAFTFPFKITDIIKLFLEN